MMKVRATKQLTLDKIYLWRIYDGTTMKYRISVPGLAQDTINKRVMIRGKQTEEHVLGQYKDNANPVTINKYSVIDYMTLEEQVFYTKLVQANKIRECIEVLRKLEDKLNLEYSIKKNSYKSN